MAKVRARARRTTRPASQVAMLLLATASMTIPAAEAEEVA